MANPINLILFLILFISVTHAGLILHFNESYSSQEIPLCDIFTRSNIHKTYKVYFEHQTIPEGCTDCAYWVYDYAYNEVQGYSEKALTVFLTSGFECGHLEVVYPADLDISTWFDIFQVSYTRYDIVVEFTEALRRGDNVSYTITPNSIVCFFVDGRYTESLCCYGCV